MRTTLEGVLSTYRHNQDCSQCLVYQDEIAELLQLLNKERQERIGKFTLHPAVDRSAYKTNSKCGVCGQVANLMHIMNFCQGKTFLWFWRLCPKQPHMHVKCLTCQAMWLEQCLLLK